MTSPNAPQAAARKAVTSDDLDTWRAEVASIDHEIYKLTERKHGLNQRISAAETLFGLMSGELPANAEPKRKYGRQTFVEVVRTAVIEAGRITSADLRKAVEDSALGSKLAESDKGFYHALARLSERGTIKRHRGWYFSAKAFHEHEEAMKAGAPDVEEVGAVKKSPMAEEIASFVSLMGRAKSSEILAHLLSRPEFRETLTANPTGAYNVMSRMVSRGELIKTEGRVYLPVPSVAANEAGSSGHLFEGRQ